EHDAVGSAFGKGHGLTPAECARLGTAIAVQPHERALVPDLQHVVAGRRWYSDPWRCPVVEAGIRDDAVHECLDDAARLFCNGITVINKNDVLPRSKIDLRPQLGRLAIQA